VYRLALRREFEARHFLVGVGDGPESVDHAHPYRLEWILEGPRLDAHGYLVDLIEVADHLEATLDRFRGARLNDLPEFAGLNPSLEHFARVLAERLGAPLAGRHLGAHTVRLWESDEAWASYRVEL